MKPSKLGYYAVIGFLVSIIVYGTISEPAVPQINEGEAWVRFTGWSGWVVETRNHLLVFDYVELGTDNSKRVFENGFITDEEIRDKRIRVFVSHIHGDHYGKQIWDWRDLAEDIKYFIGWSGESREDTFRFFEYRANYTDDTLKVSIINKPNSPISEVAYLVQVDGLTIYHSGDLVTSNPNMRLGYAENIEYISGLTETVDLAFITKAGTWNNTHLNALDIFTLETMSPRVVFPSHAEWGGQRYIDYELEVWSRGINQIVGVARFKGDSWMYSDGRLTETP